jgi:hypothetical protein
MSDETVKPKKEKKEKKDKKKKSDGATPSGAKVLGISIVAHPRARRSIRRIRAWTALGAFVVVLVMSHRSGVPNQEAALRALIAGLVGNLAGWACAMVVWRQLMMAELRLVEDIRRERRRAHAEAATAAAAELAAARASAAAS